MSDNFGLEDMLKHFFTDDQGTAGVEKSSKVTLNSRYNQEHCLLKHTVDSSEYYLEWNMDLKAPTTDFMNHDNTNTYLYEWYGEKANLYVATDKVWIDKIVADNRAGANGETLSWEQIIEKYGCPSGAAKG